MYVDREETALPGDRDLTKHLKSILIMLILTYKNLKLKSHLFRQHRCFRTELNKSKFSKAQCRSQNACHTTIDFRRVHRKTST